MARREPLVARESFVADVDGREVIVRVGELVDGEAPVAKSHRHMFEPDATAEPDREQRGRRQRRRS